MKIETDSATATPVAARLARLLVVDDDPLFLDALRLNLEDEGFDVLVAESGAQALDLMAADPKLDAVLLDWQMPGMDGIEVLRRMRASGNDAPVIFLTALSNQIYEEAALERGAVDFVEKSRSFSIILRRIRLITAGAKPSAPGAARGDAAAFTNGRLALRLDTSRAFWDGRQVALTLTEFKVVRLLAGRIGEDVAYRDIYDVVRGEGFIAGQGEQGYRANVRTLVKRVRQKFRDIDPGFAQLENYPGFGYRWIDDQGA